MASRKFKRRAAGESALILGSVIGGGIGRRLLVSGSGIRLPTTPGASVRPGTTVKPGTGAGFISRLPTANARVGMIADTTGRKEGAKVWNTVGVGRRPGRGTVGITTGSAVTRLMVTKDATRNSKVTYMVEPGNEKRERFDMIALDLVVVSDKSSSNKTMNRERLAILLFVSSDLSKRDLCDGILGQGCRSKNACI